MIEKLLNASCKLLETTNTRPRFEQIYNKLCNTSNPIEWKTMTQADAEAQYNTSFNNWNIKIISLSYDYRNRWF